MILLQGWPPGNGNGGPPPPPNGPFQEVPCIACIPIDQGAVLLITIGLLLGIYLLIKENKENGRQG